MKSSCPILTGTELVPLAEKFKGNESAVGLLLLLTLAKAACANKVADFIAPFMKNLASKMQQMYTVSQKTSTSHLWLAITLTHMNGF